MKLKKEHIFNSMEQLIDAPQILQWEQIRVLITGATGDEESCPILTF
ncbi:hypothetical protein [Sphingobacterium sp.]|nr:hypothetical protein [Sphingobacterium sp.]